MINLVEVLKKNYCLVRVKGSNLTNFIQHLTKLELNVRDINYLSSNEVHLEIELDDFKQLKKAFPSYRIKILKNKGLVTLKPFLKKHRVFIGALIFGLALIITLSQVLVRVEVIHANSEIRDLVRNELAAHGIRRFRFKKSYERLQVIKNKILNKYPEQLEWLEIEVRGMHYIVRIEERIIPREAEVALSCHVIATKDAIITRIIAYSGLTLKRIDNYVRSNDILISGLITVNDDVKGTVCARGRVYGEVWYTVSVSVPLHYAKRIETGRRRYNFFYRTNNNENTIFRSRFQKSNKSLRPLFNLFGFQLYLQIEKEYRSLPQLYTEMEAIEHGMKLAREKLSIRLDEEAVIHTQKVLRKALNAGTMELEIFFVVNELISKITEFTYNPETPPESS